MAGFPLGLADKQLNRALLLVEPVLRMDAPEWMRQSAIGDR